MFSKHSVGTQEVEMTEVEQAPGSASSTPESSPQPDNRGGTTTVELSSPQPNNAPPSTLDTTGGNTQGAQPHTAGGANVLNQPAQEPRDAQPHPAGGANVLDQPAQEPGDAQPHPAGGANVLDQPAQEPRDAQPHPAGGATRLELPLQEAVPCTVNDQGTPSSDLVIGRLTPPLSLSQMQMGDLDNNKQPR